MPARVLIILILFGSISCKSAEEKSADLPPNVIFILADDLGYGDLGFLGQQYSETPNIDQLAADGMFFSHHYAGSTVCAPSRSALLTGLHTGHTPIRANSEVQPEGQFPMADTLLTLSKVFQEAGYATGAFGKWGLGMNETSGHPSRQGFDSFFGYLCQRYAHRYYPAYLWENQEKVELPGNDWTNKVTYAPDVIQEKTLEFIGQNQSKPFFLFMPIVLPHAELAVPDDEIFQKYRQKFGEETPHIGPLGGDYGPEMKIPAYQSQPFPHATHAAMVARIDKIVGEVVTKLEALGLSENTLIIFSSDNGPHREGGADPDFFDSNGIFRGYKRDLYEGGIRVPTIVKWPAKVKAGSASNHASAFWDWLPTFAELVGNKAPLGIDGISLLPTLLGEKEQPKHDHMYWEFHESGGRQAVQKEGWKLVKYQIKDVEKTTVELFNLSVDPGETQDLAKENPAKVAELDELIKKAHRPNPMFRLFEN